jgi:hypothetical protein
MDFVARQIAARPRGSRPCPLLFGVASLLLLQLPPLFAQPPPALTHFAAAGPGASTLWEGRIVVDNGAGSATFDWPGVRVSFAVQNTASVWATIASPGATRGLFRVYVDGANSSSFFSSNVSSLYCLARALSPAQHNITLVSDLEPALLHPQPFLPSAPFEALSVETVAVEAPGGALAGAPAAKARRIAVVGDSITCGFGAGGTAPADCPNPEVYAEANSATYGRLLCARFDAACDIVAWSGKGLYENSPTAGTNETMVSYYTAALGAGQQPYAQTWAFSAANRPDAVIINLGTKRVVRPPNPRLN